VSRALRIALATEPFEQADGDVAVASFFSADRPLRGAAGRADWRLCGMLSALIAEGRLSGAEGEALLMPTFGRLRAPRLLVLGLGGSTRFGAAEVAGAARDAVSRLLDLRARSAVVSIPGEWIGAVPARPAAEAVARGALEALAPRGEGFALRLLVAPEVASRALRGLEAAASRARVAGIGLDLPDLDPEPGVPVRRARSTPSGSGPIFQAPSRP